MTSPHGTLRRSMRWSTADSSVGASRTQSPRPAIVPSRAASVPDDRAVSHEDEANVLVRGPTAASMPSWRSRRWATTANLLRRPARRGGGRRWPRRASPTSLPCC